MNPIITYENYELFPWGTGYKSEIDGKWKFFDSASQWKQYIDFIKGKR